MKVTIDDFSTIEGFSAHPGFCRKGGRAWFKRHGLSWPDFVANGIDAETMLAIGDGLGIALVEHAVKREQARG